MTAGLRAEPHPPRDASVAVRGKTSGYPTARTVPNRSAMRP